MRTKVTGPVTGGSHGWPYGGAVVDLAAEGYVEEEFFLEGTATRYRPVGEFGSDGRWSAEPAGTAPFVTRALVRRPIDSARFNGTVIVEWNNVSAGSEIFEAGDTRVVFDEGFAYVGVSAQRAGVHGFAANPQGLMAWDPERYAGLEIVDDSIAYSVFAEVARACGPNRPPAPVDPLGGLEVERLLGIGGSQSAGKLVTYINAVHPIDRVFDAFIPFTWFGSGASLDSPKVMDPTDPDSRIAISAHPTQVRTDLDVPVMIVNSECETLSCHPATQPDTERFRYWEVAGAPHGPRLHMERIFAKQGRDGMVPVGFDLGVLSPVPWAPVLDAAISHVGRWMQGESPPPVQPRIEVDGGEVPKIRRDADGNAIGGVRVPEMEAALASHTAAMEEAGAGGLMGQWTPFADEVVRARYPDAGAYVAAYASAAAAAVAVGVLRQCDADAGIDRARSTPLP